MCLLLLYFFCWDSFSLMNITIFGLLFLVLAGLIPLYYLLIIRRKNINGYRWLPPGPPGLPILGNLHMLGDLPHQSLTRLAKKYGSIMSIRLGMVQAIVVSSPEMAELFLKTHDINFASRPKFQAVEHFSYGLKGLAFTPYGSYWRNVRKLCTIHLLSNSKIESFRTMRAEEVRIVVESIRVLAESDNHCEAVVDLTEKVGSLVEDVTYRMVFGFKDDKFNFKQTIQEAVKIAGAFNLADYVPSVGALDLQGWTRRIKAVTKAVDEFFEKITEEHVQEDRKQQEDHKDFMDVLLSLVDVEEEDKKLSRTNIKAIILDMLTGAMDTSTTTIEWALAELLKHPRVMKRAQQELETIVGLDKMIEESDLVKLEYLEMVVKETMRLHPVGPLLLPHESMEDIKINGYDIPKKSRVMVNVWAIGRDPQVWSKNAEEFYPERFESVDIDVKGKDFRLLPFGSGRRGCPGIQLGLMTVRLILAHLIHCFEWKLPNGMSPHDLDMSEKFGLSVPRAKHLLAIPNYRLIN